MVMDEGHIFCPEKGAGTSEASEAVIDILSRGRKRGIGGILATQRLSKLSKDAAAECQNKIIGLANIDIDRERGARELGFTRKEDILTLRDMEAGEFYAIGPALCKNVLKTKINMPKTSHPKIGKRTIKAPVATNKVRGLLDKLKDLPREVEAELKSMFALHHIDSVGNRILPLEDAAYGERGIAESERRVVDHNRWHSRRSASR